MEMKTIDNNKKNNKILILKILIPLIIAIVSFSVVSNVANNPEYQSAMIQTLETKQENILKISATTVSIAAGANFLLGDRSRSVTDKLIDLTGYMLIIMFAIMLEKYLVTIMGLVSFKIIIPIACIMFSVFTIIDRKTIRKLSLKLIVFAITAFLIIPLSVKISNIIENTYEEAKIENVISVSEKIEDNIKNEIKESDVDSGEKSNADTEDVGFFGAIKNIGKKITNTVKNVASSVANKFNEIIEKLTKLLNKLIEFSNPLCYINLHHNNFPL